MNANVIQDFSMFLCNVNLHFALHFLYPTFQQSFLTSGAVRTSLSKCTSFIFQSFLSLDILRLEEVVRFYDYLFTILGNVQWAFGKTSAQAV